jgi:glycosyltransferase involved in cell wall biosynthesis
LARAIVSTTDVPGCRQTVVEGVNGYLVPVTDPVALAAAMNNRGHLIACDVSEKRLERATQRP